MAGNYIARLRAMLEMVRKLESSNHSPEIEQQIAQLEEELREAATQMTLEACRQEVERRRAPQDRRQVRVPVDAERRLQPARRAADAIANPPPER